MGNYVAAIDLGTTKVVTIVGEKAAGGVKIIGYSEAPSSGVMRGEVVNIQKVLNSLTPTIEEVNRQMEDYEYTIKDVFVGIAGQNIRCNSNSLKRHRSNPGTLITKGEVASMLEEIYQSRVAPEEQVLHVIPQSYNVDEHMGIPDAVGMDGKEIDGNYCMFIGRINSATHSKSVIKRLGLNLKKLVLEPIASAKAVLTDDEMELGVAMVDIGGGTTDLLIYKDNIIRHTAVIPFGGNSITEDIRQICGVSLKNAETFKRQHGSCISEFAPDKKCIAIEGKDGIRSKEIPVKLLSSTIEARLSEIIATVMYEIEKSGYDGKLPAGIVLTGGSANITHIMNLTKQITGMNVRIGFPDSNTIMSTSREEVYRPCASTAVGLILKGFDFLEEEEEASAVSYGEEPRETLFDMEPSSVESNRREKKPNRGNEPRKPKEGFKKKLDNLFGDIFSADNDA